jgi:lysozyme
MPKRPLIPDALRQRMRELLTAQRSTTDIPVEAPKGERPSAVDEAVNLITKYEGFRPEAYRDPVGRMTIGYGQATPDIKRGMRTTEPEARAFVEQRVREDSTNFANRGIPVNPGMLSAAYNLGRGNLGKYGVLSALKQGDYEEAAKILETAIRAKGKVLPGLVKRRREEAASVRQSQPTKQKIIGLP